MQVEADNNLRFAYMLKNVLKIALILIVVAWRSTVAGTTATQRPGFYS